MREPTLKFPVTCPACALESLSEVPIAVLANALLTGKGIRLHSNCHDHYWTATCVEREELRNALALMPIESPAQPLSLARQWARRLKASRNTESP
ncbi:MAG TPA: hypothetical protein VGJ20_18905 [Xanthobacteraceae bacterium]|jgi:hypothetical protein